METHNPKTQGMRLVLIEWTDSLGCSSTWQPLDSVESPKPLVCKSVGWLLHDGKDCKVIVPHVTEDHGSAKRQGCGDMTIPSRCIVKLTTLRERTKIVRAH
jgi:hypothetical protein